MSILGGAAVGVIAVLGLGGWAALSLLSTGSQPSSAIPANAVGYLSLDLDPSASQKIEAIKILKKFPGIEKELDIGDRDDLRRYVFEMMQEDGVCKDLNYESDVEPWIGDRIALAAMPGDKNSVVPLVALQVTDQDAAATGVAALADCAESKDETGFAFGDDYVLIAEGKSKAEEFVADASESALADDARFKQWTDAAGSSGIVTMYAAPEAPALFLDDLMDLDQQLADPTGVSELSLGTESPSINRATDQMKAAYKDFAGMAGVVRFEDGTTELEVAGQGLPAGMSASREGADTGVSSLPASTGAALSVSLSPGWVQDYLDQMSAAFGGGEHLESSIAALEDQTGLSIPEDIETLLGDSVAVAVDADVDFEALSDSEDPSQIPAGIKVQGDAEEILAVVKKIRTRIGPAADLLVTESADGVVVLGLDETYVRGLLEAGQLGDEDAFSRVVPEADNATGVFYLNFDAGDGWADELAKLLSEGDPTVVDNVKPLDALGISSWMEGEEQHGLLRLTTD